MRTLWLAFSGLLTLVSALGPSSAATIHVPDEAPTIQAGIDAATAVELSVLLC